MEITVTQGPELFHNVGAGTYQGVIVNYPRAENKGSCIHGGGRHTAAVEDWNFQPSLPIGMSVEGRRFRAPNMPDSALSSTFAIWQARRKAR